MRVRAKDGARCPKEGRRSGWITDTDPVDVPATVYYQRLVVEGSLVEVGEGDETGEGPPEEAIPVTMSDEEE